MVSDMDRLLYSAESFEFKGGNGEGQTDSSHAIIPWSEWLLQTNVQIHRGSWYLMQR